MAKGSIFNRENHRWRKVLCLLLFILLLLAPGLRVKAAGTFTCQTWNPSNFKAVVSGDGWTIGTKRLIYYRVRFTDTAETEPISFDDADQILTVVNKTFERMSFDQFSLNWTISPVIQLDHATSYYSNLDFATLLFDVRNAAAAIGLHSEDFELDFIRCPQIPGFPQGQANIRQKGAVVHADLVNVYLHELGHNLGLFHANSWDNSHPQLKPRSAPPFPSNTSEYSETLLFDPAGLLGDGDFRSPGRSVEYGDLFDIMASGSGDYNAAFKARLGWLANNQVQTTATNGVYRLYAYDQGGTQPDRLYAIRMDRLLEGRGGGFTFRYWASFRSSVPDAAVTPKGLELHWIDQSESFTSQLLDMVSETPASVLDAPLPLGKTFTDGEAGLRITPLRSGAAGTDRWIDVQVQFGPGIENRPPSLSLSANTLEVEPGENVELAAQTNDPDGNEVSLFWNLGDGTFDSANHVTKVWKTAGQYIVTCEATDGLGGSVTRQLLIRVGNPATSLIKGRVLRDDGSPLVGALVNNGKIDSNSGIALPDFAVTRTDSDGSFILSNLSPGDYQIGAASYGWNIQRTDALGSLHLASTDISGVEFRAAQLSLVNVEIESPVIREGDATQIKFTRTGSIKDPLPLEFILNGAAGSGQDFTAFSSQKVVIPAGSNSVSIPFEALNDLDEEQPEQVIITAVPATEQTRLANGRNIPEQITYYYPGWEPRPSDAGDVWFQTQPSFRREPSSTASLTILDATPPGLQRVSILADNSTAFERPRTPIVLHVQRIGSTVSSLTVDYSLGGSAVNGLDYDLLPLSVIIPAGSDSADVVISPISDDLLEGVETVEISLNPSPKYMTQDPSTAFLFLQEDAFNSSPNTLTFGKRFDATIVIRIAGETGNTYILETSEDLSHWIPVRTNKIDISPVGIPVPPFFDVERFYRSHRVAP